MVDIYPDFPRRLKQIYNQKLPPGVDQLSDIDVDQLQHLVDDFYKRNLPPESSNTDDSINRGEGSSVI